MRLALVVSVAAAVLVLAAPADARIVVQRGIAGLRLHMTLAQVKARLGTPTKVRRGKNEFGRFKEVVYPRVTVSFQGGGRATGFRTSSRMERTAKGIGVGSTEAGVRAKIAHVICRTESGFRHCFVGRFLPGRVVTDFRIRHGRVASITLGYVLD
jgi:hypothetical protein